MEDTTFFSLLLPDTTLLRLDSWQLDTAASLITVSVTSTQTIVPCPVCAVPTARIHSRYTRTLADLPWAAYRVHLQLRVRKWFCANPACVQYPRVSYTDLDNLICKKSEEEVSSDAEGGEHSYAACAPS
jgi:transposase